ncbi:MAG: exodeoxyribonuclease V subunit gamma [Spirochaetales bacterium]|nr:exodeoxyribonuclease V subunit gamma [Spirochaetales bacterium]
MSYSIFIDYSVEDLLERISLNYKNKVKDVNIDGFFYEKIPIFVSQSEGIYKYLFFKLTEEEKILINIKTFNLQSFYNEYSKPYLQDTKYSNNLKNNSNNLEIKRQINKETIFWFLYSYFFDIILKSYEQIRGKDRISSNDSKISCIEIDKNRDFEFQKNDFIDSSDFKKLVNFLIIFADLYEQYETYRDFEDWDILKNQDLSKVDYSILNGFFQFNEYGKFTINNKIYEDSFQIELIKLIINSPLKNTKHHILKRIKNCDKDCQIKPKYPKNPIFFIAFDNIPYFYFYFLKKISEFVDIYFYFLLPSKEFLDQQEIEKQQEIETIKDDFTLNETENKGSSYLLSFCAPRQKEFMKEFLKFFQFNICSNISSCNVDSKNVSQLEGKKKEYNENDAIEESLLQKYQIFLNNSKNQDDSFIKNSKLDDSIQIFSNYTELRELEVIKDKILEVLSKDRSLKYEDIIIMTVDSSRYLPYIEIVFKYQEPSLPIFVVDRDSSKDSEIFNTINLFLELLSSNFSKSNFLDFMSSEIIMRKFDLQIKDIDTFNRLFSNYLWGSDFDDLAEYLEEISEKNFFNQIASSEKLFDYKDLSFNFDIESSFLSNTIGYISSNSYFEKDSFIEFNKSIIPLNTEIEGEFIERVEKFFLLYRLLLYFYKFSKKPHLPKEYLIFFENFFDYLTLDSEEYHHQILYYRNKINEFFDEIGKVLENKEGYGFKISFDTLKLCLKDYLKSYQYSYGWTTGRILFSEMISLRNVPAKVISILGLNDLDFPRNTTPFSFDLLIKDKRCWDREIRESDKYLFLESILSAKKYLFLSYIGKNPTDNKEKAPSIALKIFQEDINSNLLKDEKLTAIQIPIQPFSKKYYFKNFDISNDSCFKTYSKSWLTFFKVLFEEKSEVVAEQLKNINNKSINFIDIDDFLDFIKNPFKLYLKKVMNVDLYLSDYDFDNEFDQFAGKRNFETLFFNLVNLSLKKDENKSIDQDLLNYYKIKYLKPRGILTEIDYDMLKKRAENFSNKLKSMISPNPKSIYIKQIKIKEEKLESLNYPILLKSYQVFIDDNIKPQFLLIYKQVYKQKKEDILLPFLFLFHTYFYNIEEIAIIEINKNDKFIIAKLEDSLYDFASSNDSNLKNQKNADYKSEKAVKSKSLKKDFESISKLMKIMCQNKNVENKCEITNKDKNQEIAKQINDKISALFNYYNDMIINGKLLPIFLFNLKTKKDIDKYIKLLENKAEIKENLENIIFEYSYEKDYFDLSEYYKKWAFFKYIDEFVKKDNQDLSEEYIEAISTIAKILININDGNDNN